MVGAVEKKPGTAGDRAEFSNTQVITVDGVVVEYIILLKIPGIVDKIMVNGKCSDVDCRILWCSLESP